MKPRLVPVILIVALTLGMPAVLRAADAEAIARHRHQRAIAALDTVSTDAGLDAFAREHLAPALCDSMPSGAILSLLARMRSAAAGADEVLDGRDGSVSWVRFVNPRGETTVRFRMQWGVPYLITWLEIEPRKPGTEH